MRAGNRRKGDWISQSPSETRCVRYAVSKGSMPENCVKELLLHPKISGIIGNQILDGYNSYYFIFFGYR